jgi:hypothetical protein
MLCGQIPGLPLLISILWPYQCPQVNRTSIAWRLLYYLSFAISLFRCIQKWWKVTIRFVRSACLSVCASLRLSTRNSAPAGRIFFKFVIWGYCEYMSPNSSLKSENNKGDLHEYLYGLIISGLILLTIKKFSDKTCLQNQNTQFIFKNLFRN